MIVYDMDSKQCSKTNLEVDLTQNRETTALWTLNAVDLFYFIMCEEGPHDRKSSKEHLVEGPVTNDFTLHLRIHDHIAWFWGCVGTTALGHFSFGLSQFHGHGSWLVCEVAHDLQYTQRGECSSLKTWLLVVSMSSGQATQGLECSQMTIEFHARDLQQLGTSMYLYCEPYKVHGS